MPFPYLEQSKAPSLVPGVMSTLWEACSHSGDDMHVTHLIKLGLFCCEFEAGFCLQGVCVVYGELNRSYK